jgi:hypothetical protein
MKPDIDLIRVIMTRLEADKNGTRLVEAILEQGKTELEIAAQVKHLEMGGLIDASLSLNRMGIPCGFNIWGITKEGYDFIKAAKNQKLWRKALDQMKKHSMPVRVSILAKILTSLPNDPLKFSSNREAMAV